MSAFIIRVYGVINGGVFTTQEVFINGTSFERGPATRAPPIRLYIGYVR